MGFDLYGKKKDDEGKQLYFRASVWSWRPLWNLACDLAKVGADIRKACQYNDGHKVSFNVANRIANAIDKAERSGELRKLVDTYEAQRKALPQIQCCLCKGTGKRTDMVVENGCNACRGSGKVDPDAAHYPLHWEMILEFSKFCRASGGFEVY